MNFPRPAFRDCSYTGCAGILGKKKIKPDWKTYRAKGLHHREGTTDRFDIDPEEIAVSVGELRRMITFLNGKLTSALPTQATVDVGGVGYEVAFPLSSYDKLPAVGEPLRILTHLHVREDAHILYGFMTAPERDLFRLLVNNSGIGPKLALTNEAWIVSFLSAVSKTAGQIVLELKDKLGVVAACARQPPGARCEAVRRADRPRPGARCDAGSRAGRLVSRNEASARRPPSARNISTLNLQRLNWARVATL